MPKKVFLEPAWKLPLSANYITMSPPDGYEFVRADDAQERLSRGASRWNASYRLLGFLDSLMPAVLVNSWLQRWRKPPPGTSLTYAFPGHIVFRPEPWVVQMEYPSLLVGMNIKHFIHFRHLLERTFASPFCKKIICEFEAGRRALTSALDCSAFEHKVVVVYPAPPPPRQFAKVYATDAVKLLFVGSANIKGDYELWRGLREVLEMFAVLCQRYSNLELVVRAQVPRLELKRYYDLPNLRIIDRVVPWHVLEQEFLTADIFVLPCHHTPPYGLMDAMSYELPVVTLNVWANGEFIKDGRTGLLVEPSKRVSYYYGNTANPNYASAEFRRAIRNPDPEVVGELVQKVSLLIENPELRRRLGKAARHEVEAGKFSRARRNEKLKKIFDEATGGDPD